MCEVMHVNVVVLVCIFDFLEFAVHELLLPDAAMVHGRFVVSAWEFGLDGIQDDAAKLLSLAVEVCTSDSSWCISSNVCRLLLARLHIV